MNPICLILLLVFSSTFSPIVGEICSICSNATHVMNDESARIIWPPGNPDNTGLRCSEAATKAGEGFFSNCSVLHSYSDVICSCGEEEPPFTCPLCGGGGGGTSNTTNDLLPEPNRVVAGKTCQQWEEYASTSAFSVDCIHYQTLLGAYCGCDISSPNYFEGYCRLCEDRLLPDMSEKVTYQSGKQAYCVEVEINLNTHPDQYNCESYQDTHEKACGCDSNDVEFPTLRPSSNNESSASSMSLLSRFVGIQYLVFLTLGILTYLN